MITNLPSYEHTESITQMTSFRRKFIDSYMDTYTYTDNHQMNDINALFSICASYTNDVKCKIQRAVSEDDASMLVPPTKIPTSYTKYRQTDKLAGYEAQES